MRLSLWAFCRNFITLKDCCAFFLSLWQYGATMADYSLREELDMILVWLSEDETESVCLSLMNDRDDGYYHTMSFSTFWINFNDVFKNIWWGTFRIFFIMLIFFDFPIFFLYYWIVVIYNNSPFNWWITCICDLFLLYLFFFFVEN